MSMEHMQRDGLSFFRSRFRRLRGTAVQALHDLLLQVMDRADIRLDTARNAFAALVEDNRLNAEALFDEAMIREHGNDFILCTFTALFLRLGCSRVPRLH